MTTITTYLCNTRLPIGDITTNYGAISTEEGLVTAKITTVDCMNTENLIRLPVISEYTMSSDVLFFRCIEDLLGSENFTWSRKANFNTNGDFTELDTYITIEGNDPDLVCMWKMTRVYGITLDPADRNVLLVRYPSTVGGEIPGTKSEACQLTGSFTLNNTQTDFVPGELLQLEWSLEISGETYVQAVAGSYFASPAITGGQVVSVPSSEDVERVYDMNVQGNNISCIPTDFAEYVSGEWTYLLKQEASEAKKCDRNSSYTNNGAQLENSEILRLLPMTVNSFGNTTGNFEKLQYDMLTSSSFSNFYEISCHVGIIQSIDGATGTADVQITDSGSVLEGQTFSAVPIFYHCRGETTTANGFAAFLVDDEVLLLNKGGTSAPSASDLTIIGFPDKVKECVQGIIVIASPSGNEAFAWDAINNELLIAYDTYDSVMSQLNAVENQALPDGNKLREDFPWDYSIYDTSVDFTTTTEIVYISTSYQGIFHPDQANMSTDYYIPIVLEYSTLAFGVDVSARQAWVSGDFVTLQTYSGSSTIDLITVSSTDGTFDKSYFRIPDVDQAIDCVWTFTISNFPQDGGFAAWDERRFLFLQTNIAGIAKDYRYSFYRAVYPMVPEDMSSTGSLDYPYSSGFSYNVTRGNYIEAASLPSNTVAPNVVAPVIYQYDAKALFDVSQNATDFETLTGISIPSDIVYSGRTKLFYYPSFAFPWKSYTLWGFLNYHESMWNTDIPRFFDDWKDCDWPSDPEVTPVSDGVLNVTTGIAQAGEHAVVYDAYSIEQTTGNTPTGSQNKVHVFYRVTTNVAGIVSDLERNIFEGINAERATGGLENLAFQLNLYWAAKRHAQDMANNYATYKAYLDAQDYNSAHTGTDGTNPFERMLQEGYLDYHILKGLYYHSGMGENVAYSIDLENGVTADDFVTAWMSSESHRVNLLTPEWVDTGVACVTAADGSVFACQTFALCEGRWPGYSPLPADGLNQYLLDNFTWSGTGDNIKIPELYLI